MLSECCLVFIALHYFTRGGVLNFQNLIDKNVRTSKLTLADMITHLVSNEIPGASNSKIADKPSIKQLNSATQVIILYTL